MQDVLKCAQKPKVRKIVREKVRIYDMRLCNTCREKHSDKRFVQDF